MLNIEKYKDEILNAAQSDITCCVIDLYHNGICPDDCKDCKREAMEWLLSEYKEPILNDVEKNYLTNLVRPFRKEVRAIEKLETPFGKEYILIILKDDGMHFPSFEKGKMYKGMETHKEYTLQELGL